MSGKIDFKTTLACYRARRDAPQIVQVPDLSYLMIDGRGDPNSQAFTDAIAALYPVSYKLKFASKELLGRDYVVPPLEGLWWADDMGTFTTARNKTQWEWTAMMMVPQWITDDMLTAARESVRCQNAPVRLSDLRLEVLSEGMCVQALHVGPYDAEGDLLAQMHRDFIPGAGLLLTGRHHEIYLSDARKTDPAKLRTIVRQPVAAG